MAVKSLSSVKVVGLEKLAPQLKDTLMSVGDRAVFLIAEKIAENAKKRAPLLSEYGVRNARISKGARWVASRGNLRRSIGTMHSKKYPHSYLAVANDWRARFIEYGTDAHTMPKSKGGLRRKAYRFLDSRAGVTDKSNIIYTKRVKHPGTEGAKFMEKSSTDTAVDSYIAEVIAEIENGSW